MYSHIKNCTQKIIVYNSSQSHRTIRKGVKLASCSGDFEEYCYGKDIDNNVNKNTTVNLAVDVDPIHILCEKITVLNTKELHEVKTVLNGFRDILSVSNNKIGKTNLIEFDIENNITPVTVPLRRVPMHHREIVEELIKKYEDLNLIQPIHSPFRAPTVLVRKKNDSGSADVTDQYRICTDYRVLNNQLSASGWPSPSLDECLDAVGDANFFSSIDFKSGYHQIPCSDNAKQALAFSPGYGFKQYTWSVMPPGIKTASSCFQRAMQQTFQGNEARILPPYYDDIIIKGKGFQNHLENVKVILNDVRKAGFTLNVLKCSFLQKSTSYLGHVISENSIMIDPRRIKAIIELPTPTDVKGLRSFIGMIQFCHKFVNNLNVILAPLYDLLKIRQQFIWSPHCQAAFESLKSILSSPPVLYSPSKRDSFILETDASDKGLGGCLKVVKGTEEFVVAYCSKKFVDSEINWNIVEKETFAIIHDVRYFHHYLIGNKFTIRCDNRIVTHLKDKRNPRNKKMLNWALELSDYDYSVVHILSKNNILDCLTRLLMISHVTPIIFPGRISNQDVIDHQSKDDECAAAKMYLLQKRQN